MENRYYIRGIRKTTMIKIFNSPEKERRYLHLMVLITKRYALLDNTYKETLTNWY